MDSYTLGFEEDDRLRSAFTRDLTLQQRNRPLKAALFVPVVICHDDLNGRR